MFHPSPRLLTKFTIPACLSIAAISAAQASALTLSNTDITTVFTLAQTKYNAYYTSLTPTNIASLGVNSSGSVFPVSTGGGNNSWSSKTNATDWRAGFSAGVLWEIYGFNGNTTIKTEAQNLTFGLRNNVDVGDHDVGFRTLPSYGLGAKLVGPDTVYTFNSITDDSYRQQIFNAGEHLASRYLPAIGLTRSWDTGNTTTTAAVIVDNMMNLQIMVQAQQLGDTTKVAGLTLTQIAAQHAATTFNDFVRADGSSVHEVIYNLTLSTPGHSVIIDKESVQGITTFGKDTPGTTGELYETQGTWSRGQSWLVNGFTAMYAATKDDPTISNPSQYLSDAQTVANYWVKRTLQNVAAGRSYIPPTDFDVSLVTPTAVPDNTSHQDASAAAIAADGLLQLASFTTDPTLKAQYWSVAVGTLNDLLSTTYFSTDVNDVALIQHEAQQYSTGGENTSFIYGDYYLLEALSRYQALAPLFAAPEPASLSLLAFPVALTLLRRRRK